MHKLSIGVSIGKFTRDQAVEQIRKELVYAVRAGETLVLHCGNIAPDFKSELNDPSSGLNLDVVFNVAEFKKEENFKKILHAGEDHDLMGNKGCFWYNDNFTIVILQNDDDEETKEELLDRIPQLNNFDIINV